jgi:hypothetical protein
MSTIEDGKREKAETFLQKIALKLPLHSISESTIIDLFNGIIESLDKSSIRTTILADLDSYYNVFEIELKKQQTSINDTTLHKKKSQSKGPANTVFPVTSARILLGKIDENFVSYNSSLKFEENNDNILHDKNAYLNLLITLQCGDLSVLQLSKLLLRSGSLSVAEGGSSGSDLSKALLSR